MVSYPVYPEENMVIFTGLFGGASVLMIILAFVVSYFESPKENRSWSLKPLIKQRLIGFIFMFISFYFVFSYLTMKTIFINKETKEFTLAKTLFGNPIQEKKYQMSFVQEISIVQTNIDIVHEVILMGGAFQLPLGKGEIEYAEKLGKDLSREFGVPVKRRP